MVAAPFAMATPFGWRTVTVALEHLDSGARTPRPGVDAPVARTPARARWSGTGSRPRRSSPCWRCSSRGGSCATGRSSWAPTPMALSASRHLRLAPILLAPVAAACAPPRPRLGLRSGLVGRSLDLRGSPWSPAVCRRRLPGDSWGSGPRTPSGFIDYPRAVPRRTPWRSCTSTTSTGTCGTTSTGADACLWAVPQAKVAADGRHLSAYSPELLATNIGLGRGGRDPLAVLRHYGARTMVLLSARRPGPAATAPSLHPALL